MLPEGYGTCSIVESVGKYYVYTTQHSWDKTVQKRVAKRRSIGRIDPELGFIPNSFGRQMKRTVGTKSPDEEIAPAGNTESVPETSQRQPKAKKSIAKLKWADGYELFLQTGPHIAPLLEEHLGSDAPMMLAISLMRLVESELPFELAHSYPSSYASALWPGLQLTKAKVANFLIHIGKRTEEIQGFLHALVTPGKKILVDGTGFFEENTSHEKGLDAKIRMAFVMDRETLTPQYYTYVGSQVTAPALIEIAREAGVADGLAVLSKNGWTKDGSRQLAAAGLRYVMECPCSTDDTFGIQWLRTHGNDGFRFVFNDYDFGDFFGRILPLPDGTGSIYAYLFSSTMRKLSSVSESERRKLPDSEFGHLSYVTNLDDTLEDLPEEMAWHPNTNFQFLALQQTLHNPWRYGFLYDAPLPSNMNAVKRGLAFSDFIALLYWQTCDHAAALAGVDLELVDLLHVARSDTVFPMKNGIMQATSSAPMRRKNFKLLGITMAKDK